MKTLIKNIIKITSFFLCALLLSLNGFSQAHVTMSLRNIKATSNTIEYDLYIVNDGNESFKLSACSYGVNIKEDIFNGGSLSYSYVKESKDKSLNAIPSYSLASTKGHEINQLRMTSTPLRIENAPELMHNIPVKIGRFIVTNSESWSANSNPAIALQELPMLGLTTTQIVGFVGDKISMLALTPTLLTVATKVEPSPMLNMYEAKSSSHETTFISNEDEIKLYPNPTSDELNIDFVSAKTSNITIKINDLNGKVVKENQVQTQEGTNHLVLSLNVLGRGIYILQMIESDHLKFVQRIHIID